MWGKMKFRFQIKMKKAVSPMIGYVLLIGIVIVISGMVYLTIKTYVPVDEVKCDEGVSIMIGNAECDSDNDRIILTLKNNGRFDLEGYTVKATTAEGQKIPGLDFSKKSFGIPLEIGAEYTETIELNDKKIYSILVTPILVEGKKLIDCGDASVRQDLKCPE
jgi:FlaG/FlaF family flagellin (archaellin)